MMRQGFGRPGDLRPRGMRRGPGYLPPIEKARDPRRTFLRLLRYLSPYRLALAFVLMLVLVSTFLGLVGPYLMGRAIDRFIGSRDAVGLVRMALWMLGVFLLGNLADALSGWKMAGVSQRALQRLRRELFVHLQGLPLRFFDSRPAGELMSRLTNDIEAINQAVSQNAIGLLGSTLSLLGIVVAMFVLNFWLALASVVVVPLMLWFTEWIARSTRKGFRELQKHLGELNAILEESISGLRVLKAFRRSEAAIQAFEGENEEVYRAGVYANSFALLLMPLTNQLGNLFVIAIAGLGGWLALRGLATVGTIIAFISYARAFISPLRQISNIYNAIQAALAGAERVFEVLDTPPESPDPPDALPLDSLRGEVRFEGVTFGYLPDRPVIRNVSLEARPGQTVALVGPTGAGKTTIVNLLMRFYEPDAGCIQIDGRDIRRIRRDDLRRQLGMVLQDTFLFSGTVMDNIRYGRPEASDEEVVRAAELAGADPFIRQLPQGYQTPLSERASNLSQGQRQLLAIARAILTDPAILILDEATSNVDTRTEVRIQRGLLRLMQGRTAFVIAHRLSTIRDADQVLVIRDGEIVERGTYRELMAKKGFYYRLYMTQFKGEAI